MKRYLSIVLFLLNVTFIHAAAPQNITKAGVAIDGYDPVSYFTSEQPAKGSADHTATYQGATYHFSSRENRATFEANPSKYTPQYGGYCAYGVSIGKLFKVDPKVYTIHQGKLYLQFNSEVAETYLQDLSANVATSDAEWKKLAK